MAYELVSRENKYSHKKQEYFSWFIEKILHTHFISSANNVMARFDMSKYVMPDLRAQFVFWGIVYLNAVKTKL